MSPTSCQTAPPREKDYSAKGMSGQTELKNIDIECECVEFIAAIPASPEGTDRSRDVPPRHNADVPATSDSTAAAERLPPLPRPPRASRVRKKALYKAAAIAANPGRWKACAQSWRPHCPDTATHPLRRNTPPS